MVENNRWTGYKTWARAFLFSKRVSGVRCSIVTEGNGPIHGDVGHERHSLCNVNRTCIWNLLP